MDWFIQNVLGLYGVMGAIGILFFGLSYRNSVKLFGWIEDQTFGTRDYILNKCELLFVEIKPEYITYGLITVSIGIPFLIFGAFALFSKFFLGAFVAGFVAIAGWKGPRPIMNWLVNRRIKIYQGQMVDGLNLLSNGLRAGLSLPQACGMVVDELPKPISQEFNLILQQNKIGIPLEECFENLHKRVPTEDNQMFSSAVSILRETGGNLAEVFDTISEVIRERVRLQQKIETFIAQGKFQGGMIFLMPYIMLMLFSASDPQSVAPLFERPLGLVALFVAVILDLIGGFFIWKIIQIKV